MDIQALELTIQEVLAMHKYWITSLYVEDGKSEEEIVALLYERRLTVSLCQIRKCLTDWSVIPSTSHHSTRPHSNSTSESHSMSKTNLAFDDWEIVPSLSSSPTLSIASCSSAPSRVYTISPENIRIHYAHLPLPPTPKDKRKGERVYGRELKQKSHECDGLERGLQGIPRGPSPLDIYTKEKQRNEMVALGVSVGIITMDEDVDWGEETATGKMS
ncbi:hypothetical protein B7494_g4779 [Chlorociboria aeruginascens]|nr:hypothetical protein B7494_g4779 [Chlorociboria aeruginascens]